MAKAVAPYGSWKSPITSDRLVQSVVSLSQPEADGDDVYWLEGRPEEAGRVVVVRRTPDDVVADAIPPGFSARTTVHEYGGGAYTVHNGVVYFSNFDDQRVYRVDRGADPRPITPEPAIRRGLRYADARVTADGAHLVCVREVHDEHTEARNEIVVLPTDGSAEPTVLASGHDFYAAPRLSPDGTQLAFLGWDHPRMPWDGTELWVAALNSDWSIDEPRLVAGSPEESVVQPVWSPSGVLHFASDRTGWWNLYRHDGRAATPLAQRDAEFASAAWAFGQASYCFLGDGGLACLWSEKGRSHLGVIPPGGGQPLEASTAHTSLSAIRAFASGVIVIGASPTAEPVLEYLDLATAKSRVLRRSRESQVDERYISVPEPIEFPTEGDTAHAFYYAPANPDFDGPDGERPPLLVMSHGGPTGATSSVLSLRTQYWTSRGIAVVDVNYRGSTGFGRAYRQKLNGTWGITDVVDCINAARHLAERGDVDGDRLLIRGGSAGGYTTLCALTFHDAFAAGASHYGVADAEALARDTHKFESRYLDGLIGPYPAARDVYVERSPIHFADQISCPVILFQGLEDKVVPPAQAEEMVAALEKKGVPYAYVTFEGEQHGFRKAENIKRSFEAELFFYSRVLGFELADSVEPVEIHGNLAQARP